MPAILWYGTSAHLTEHTPSQLTYPVTAAKVEARIKASRV